MAEKTNRREQGAIPVAHRTRSKSGDGPFVELPNRRSRFRKSETETMSPNQNNRNRTLTEEQNTNDRSQISSLDSSLLEQDQQERNQDMMQQRGNSPEQSDRNGQHNVQPVMIPPYNRNRWSNSETVPNVSGAQRYTRSHNHQNLRSMQPKQLKKTSDVIALKGFIQRFKSL